MKKEYKALYEKFGLNVVYYRKSLRVTQLQLAELLDIDRSHISAIELGNVGVYYCHLQRGQGVTIRNVP